MTQQTTEQRIAELRKHASEELPEFDGSEWGSYDDAFEAGSDQGYKFCSEKALSIITSLQSDLRQSEAENQRILDKWDKHYQTECEEEAFRLGRYRDDLSKLEAENKKLKEELKQFPTISRDDSWFSGDRDC